PPHSPLSPPFPYTTLFRSVGDPRLDQMQQRVLDVVDPDEAPVAVVGVAEGAPRAGGAADIGQEVVDALVEHPSGDVVVARSGLALRPPVEVDDGRSRAGPRIGAVQPAAHPETVAGGEG